MAKLTKDQWAEARARWESDPRPGFEWLAIEIGVSRPAVSKMASAHGWVKGGSTSKVTQPIKVTQVTQNQVTQVTQKVTPAQPPAKEGKGKVISITTGEQHQPAAPKQPKTATPVKPADPAWQLVDARQRGRPSEYRDEFIPMMIAYFDIEVERVEEVEVSDGKGATRTEQRVVVNKFPTLERFASKIGITRETLHDWATAKDNDGTLRRPEFSYVYTRARDLQAALLIEGGLAGLYEGRFATLGAKNLAGWKDSIEQTIEATVNMAIVETLNDTYQRGIENAKQKRLEMIERRKQFAVEDKG